MKKIIRVSKDKDIYNFIIDDLGNLIYKVIGKDESKLIHKELISSSADEVNVFVEDKNNLYLLFREHKDLKCAIIRGNNINMGTLYSYTEGNYKINNARMFIENNNINIIAILRNDDNNIRDVIIHYIYINEDVKENTIKVLNKQERYKNYLWSVNGNNIKIFYTDRLLNNKEGIFFRDHNKEKWEDECKVMDIWGSIYDLDIKEIDNKLYMAVIYCNYSINILKVCVFDENLKMEKEKVHYSLQEICNVNFIEEGDRLFVTWIESENMIISSSLVNERYIKTYKIPRNNLIICENYIIDNFSVKKNKELVSLNGDGKINTLNMEEIFKELKEEGKDIVSYGKETLEVLAKQREEKDKIMKDMRERIESLKKEISFKETKVVEMQKKYGENRIKEIKETYEESILELVRKNNLMDKEIIELQKKLKKSLMDIEQIKSESNNILEEEMKKCENKINNYEEIVKGYEETIKMNSEIINKKNDIITNSEKSIEDKDKIIAELLQKAREEENKSLISRLFKK